MEFKTLYQFTIDEEKIVEKESKRKDKKTGEEVFTKRKVKQKVPVEVKIKRPSRRELEDAELQYSIEISKCIKQGILTKAMLAKKYADTGGAFSEEGFKDYGEKYQKIMSLQNEYMRLENVENPTDKQKQKLEQVKSDIVKVKRELVEVESGLQSLFEHTADIRAQNKLLLWYSLMLTYIQREDDEEPVQYFVGNDFEEKTENYFKKEEEMSEFYQKLIKKVSTVLAFWLYNQASTPQEFENLIDKVESGEL